MAQRTSGVTSKKVRRTATKNSQPVRVLDYVPFHPPGHPISATTPMNPALAIHTPSTSNLNLIIVERGERSGQIMASELPAKLMALPTDLLATILGLGLQELARRAESDAFALSELVNLTAHSVGQLTDMAEKNEDMVRSVAQTLPMWPAFISPLHIVQQKNGRILSRLGVGTKTGLNVTAKARWTSGQTTAQYALEIMRTLQANRSWLNTLQRSDQPRFNLQDLPKWVLDCAKLDPISQDTALSWWTIGRQAMNEVIPQPHKVTELRRLIIADDKYKAEAYTLYPSEINSKILGKIKKSFLALAATIPAVEPN